ncbi:hypothetical protein GIB67_025690 [Kingdonia uniflora]|uniref:PH domain-containing protein n=1 Tax=Kingdonia uniflora TaxID=39325 RepID=A0A7J7ND56_9MAGN|nr:hypothetical protein GIB67_025690 [Kingdonia uniflora]
MRQAREKFLSLRKGTKLDTALVIEEELHKARSTLEEARFNLVTALSNVEAKKRFMFLEDVTGTMDAHLHNFKQGYDLLYQIEPYINQAREKFLSLRKGTKLDTALVIEEELHKARSTLEEARFNLVTALSNVEAKKEVQLIEAVMQSAAKGKVQAIRQGYLSKRSSNLSGDWKRRFFVLDSRGMLYYYRKEKSKPSGGGSHLAGQRNSSEMSPDC